MGAVYPGPRNPNWRGGRSLASNGYVLIRVGVGPHLADVRGYAYGQERHESSWRTESGYSVRLRVRDQDHKV
jgi:hypothetical protein